jgi:pimeloyl-ACP methyl ester carboxylesterase
VSSIEYDRRGAGEPLVLLHGLGSRRQMWAPVLDALARELDVVAIDLPGFGASPPDGGEVSISTQADRVETFFAELGLRRPHVAGNSMGGGIALELARRGSVASATALSPVGFWAGRERAFARASLRASRALALATPPRALRRLAANPLTRTALFAQMFARPWRLTREGAVGDVEALRGGAGFEAALAALDGHVFRDGHELRGVPVTIAWGERDRLLLYGRQSARARRALPWARHVTLRGCGHVPPADDPEQVAAVLLAGTRAPQAAPRGRSSR